MKRSLLAIPLSLFVLLSSVAFAAEGERPIPKLPPFVGANGSVTAPLVGTNMGADEFLETIGDYAYIVAVAVDSPVLSGGKLVKKHFYIISAPPLKPLNK